MTRMAIAHEAMKRFEENPYVAPRGMREEGGGATFPVVRLAISGILVGLGCLLLLLLNGQHFSNRVGFLLLATFSGVLWILPAVDKRDVHGSLSRWIVLIHVVIVVATLVSLPGAYEAQRRFNDAMQKFRDRSQPSEGK
jgi:hypothetical protein